MSRDPTVPVNLTTTTPVGPVERTLAATQSTDRVERLRYWRRGGVPPPSEPPTFDSSTVTFDSSTVTFDEE